MNICLDQVIMNNHLIHDVIGIPKNLKMREVFFLRYLILEIIKTWYRRAICSR